MRIPRRRERAPVQTPTGGERKVKIKKGKTEIIAIPPPPPVSLRLRVVRQVRAMPRQERNEKKVHAPPRAWFPGWFGVLVSPRPCRVHHHGADAVCSGYVNGPHTVHTRWTGRMQSRGSGRCSGIYMYRFFSQGDHTCICMETLRRDA